MLQTQSIALKYCSQQVSHARQYSVPLPAVVHLHLAHHVWEKQAHFSYLPTDGLPRITAWRVLAQQITAPHHVPATACPGIAGLLELQHVSVHGLPGGVACHQ